MILKMLTAAVWTMPLIFGLALSGCILLVRFTRIFRKLTARSWSIVDLIWILTSAVTLYFLAVGMIYDSAKSEGQLASNNYIAHIVRGRDKANDNLARYCVGPTRRILQILPEELAHFCRYNSDALTAFTQKLVVHDRNTGFIRETDINLIPTTIVQGPGNQDAVVANIEWSQVHEEFVGENRAMDELDTVQSIIGWPRIVRNMRTMWIYLFPIVIVIRAARPISELFTPKDRVDRRPEPAARERSAIRNFDLLEDP